METLQGIRGNLRGISIGEEDIPRIICLASSACFTSPDQALPFLNDLKITEIERLNSGMQAHLYTRPGDTLVAKVPPEKTETEARALLEKALRVNAEIWKEQSGIELMTCDNGTLVLSRPEEVMLSTAFQAYRPGKNVMLLPSLDEDAVFSFEQTAPGLRSVATSFAALNHKNSCMELLAANGIPVPRTFTYEARENPSERLRCDLKDLGEEIRFVFKADGSAAGVGVDTNQGQGYRPQEIMALVETLHTASRLPKRFQLQEFIRGVSMGAIAVVTSDGSFKVTDIHRQDIGKGLFTFEGAYWQASLDKAYRGPIEQIFERIVAIEELSLRGSVGIDFISQGDKLYVIEVNARTTGATPITLILDKQKKIESYVRKREASLGCSSTFRIEEMLLNLHVKVAAELLEDGKFSKVLAQVKQEAKWLRPRGAPEVLILPQGIDPFGSTKVLLVNEGPGKEVLALLKEKLLA